MLRSGLLLAFCLGLSSCGDNELESDDSFAIEFPYEVILVAERGLVAPTGEVLERANFKEADIVTYRSSGVKISSGCPERVTDCHPLHICRPSIQSLPTKFNSFEEVCSDFPEEGETTSILTAEEHMGFTVRLNTIDGTARFWVKSIEGSGPSARLTLVYSISQQ